MSYGCGGSILHIDLSRSKISRTPTSEYARLFLGGRGINAKLFFDLSKPGVDAYHPDNPIIIGAGALCGTGIVGITKGTVMTRSPEQVPQGLGVQVGGGSLYSEMKYAGYDNIAIIGRAEKPTYIQINNEDVALRNASALWGKGVFETEAILKKDIEPEVKVMSIGPAGENLVRFATIEHEWRSGTGLGGVWGSKNLKAIAVRGTKSIKVYDPETILKMNEEIIENYKKDKEEDTELARKRGEPYAGKYRSVGSNSAWGYFYHTPFGTVGYFEGGIPSWPNIEKILGPSWLALRGYRGSGCCPVACTGLVSVPGVGTSAYRCYPFFNLWTNKMVDMDGMFEATMMMSDYGLDNRNLTATVSYLQTLYEGGVITAKDTDGVAMEWGSREALTETIRKVAKREGFGDVLAEGPLALAKKLGKEAMEVFSHTRGQIIASDERRNDVVFALEEAVDSHRSTEYADHDILYEPYMKKWGMDKEIKEAYERAKKTYGSEKAIIPWEWKGKSIMAVNAHNSRVLKDILGACIFLDTKREIGSGIGMDPKYLKAFNAVTGMNANENYLITIAERTWNIEKAYNVREGFTRKDDTIADLWIKKPIESGPSKGMKVDENELEKAKTEYYKLRGWDVETSWPLEETYNRLGLQDVAQSLKKLEKLPKKKKE